jgi:hypothetical protein
MLKSEIYHVRRSGSVDGSQRHCMHLKLLFSLSVVLLIGLDRVGEEWAL